MPSSAAPRIAILYEPDSVPLLTLAELAARNVFDLVWVTDDVDTRILGRLGTVVQWGTSCADALSEMGVAGVTTFADSQIERTAALARRMGLPANSAQAARCLVDKIAQRQALAEAGVPGPGFVGIHAGEWHEDLQDLRYPVVVKPAFGFGGRDTICLPEPEAVRAHLDLQRDGGQLRSIVVEECLGEYPPSARDGFGDYVSVEVVVAGGDSAAVAVTGRMPLAEPFRETGAFLPSTLSSEEQSEVIGIAVDAARALDVHCGCLHVEIKLTALGPRVIEVNGRVPGGGIADLVLAVTGTDLFECALRSALGRFARPASASYDGDVHYQLALQPPIGRRVQLSPDWSPRLRGVRGLEHVTLRATEAEVGLCDGSYGYLLMARGAATDHDALLDTYRELYGLMAAD